MSNLDEIARLKKRLKKLEEQERIDRRMEELYDDATEELACLKKPEQLEHMITYIINYRKEKER